MSGMLHIRVISPPGVSGAVLDLLSSDPGVAHVWVADGAARKPAGDLIACEVTREAAGGVLQELRGMGLEKDGAIVVSEVDVILSEAAANAAKAAPGESGDSLVWEEMEASAGEETTLSVTFLAFMAVAAVIATIGVVMDEPILIIGAMVVGPEFGPLVALCVNLVARRSSAALAALGTLAVGFGVAVLATMLTTWLLTAFGIFRPEMLTQPRPLTDFIWKPDVLSAIVGLFAGIAGFLSLTSRKSGALVGVLISVTTIPAAANAAVALAWWVPSEAIGSGLQLLVNLAAIVIAGVVTLSVQRGLQRQRVRRSRRAMAA